MTKTELESRLQDQERANAALLERCNSIEQDNTIGKAQHDTLTKDRADLRDTLAATQQMLGEANAKAKTAATEAKLWEAEAKALRDVSAEDQRIIAHLRGQIAMLERLGMLPTENDGETHVNINMQQPFDPMAVPGAVWKSQLDPSLRRR